MIDSTGIQDVTHQIVQVALDNSSIPVWQNNITASLITIAVGIIIRFVEKRLLRKKGMLRDVK